MLVLILVMAAAPAARAYVREKAQGSGKDLYWSAMPLTFTINSTCAGSAASTSACLETVKTSFEKWTAPSCTYLAFDYQGETSRTDVGYDPDHPAQNINLVIWHFDKWPYEASGIGLTTTTYQTETGEIVDADMEYNGVNFHFAILDTPDPNFTDIANTVTHEAGHFIGLDHTSDPHSTMYPTAPYGEINKRDLSQDDIDGVCAIYPGTKADGGENHDCSCASVDAGDPAARTSFLVVLLALAAALAVKSAARKR